MTLPPSSRHDNRANERGNLLFMILIAVVLIGFLTAAIMSGSGSENANIDKETLVMRVSEAQREANEYERAVLFITSNALSEATIRFAHPAADASYGDLSADTADERKSEVFDPQGGAATYHKPPADINDGSAWEFYGGTAVPGVGSDKADLVAVLPNVTLQFCNKINEINNQSPTTPPQDTGGSLASGASPGDCVAQGPNGRFNDTQQFYATPNTMDETTFAQDPSTTAARTALQACVQCTAGNTYNFYHVLLAR
jgi:hypothetical protein